LGAIYLAFEGAEKIYEYIIPHEQAVTTIESKIPSKEELTLEKGKIKAAIVTDFILSVVVIIALGSVEGKAFRPKCSHFHCFFLATVGVYGIVALIVRMDDFGILLTANKIPPFSWLEKY
jgi:predicted DNA repair protein MutK